MCLSNFEMSSCEKVLIFTTSFFQLAFITNTWQIINNQWKGVHSATLLTNDLQQFPKTTDQLGLKGSYFLVKLFPINTMFTITTVEIVQHSTVTIIGIVLIQYFFNLLQVNRYNVTGWKSTNIYYSISFSSFFKRSSFSFKNWSCTFFFSYEKIDIVCCSFQITGALPVSILFTKRRKRQNFIRPF